MTGGPTLRDRNHEYLPLVLARQQRARARASELLLDRVLALLPRRHDLAVAIATHRLRYGHLRDFDQEVEW